MSARRQKDRKTEKRRESETFGLGLGKTSEGGNVTRNSAPTCAPPTSTDNPRQLWRLANKQESSFRSRVQFFVRISHPTFGGLVNKSRHFDHQSNFCTNFSPNFYGWRTAATKRRWLPHDVNYKCFGIKYQLPILMIVFFWIVALTSTFPLRPINLK